MLRNARHNKILELIEEKEIETQEELCKELAEANFAVTQATVSRDVRELRLFKVAGTKKRYRYAAIGKGEEELSDKMRSLFQACIESIQTVGISSSPRRSTETAPMRASSSICSSTRKSSGASRGMIPSFLSAGRRRMPKRCAGGWSALRGTDPCCARCI